MDHTACAEKILSSEVTILSILSGYVSKGDLTIGYLKLLIDACLHPLQYCNYESGTHQGWIDYLLLVPNGFDPKKVKWGLLRERMLKSPRINWETARKLYLEDHKQ